MDGAPKGAECWTTERVGAAMIEAFRVLPSMPVYAPRRAEFVSVLPEQDPSPLDMVALSEQVLGHSTLERRILLIWARSMATRGDVGGFVRKYCVDRGIHQATFYRQRKLAYARVAAELNRVAGDTDYAHDGLPHSYLRLRA